MAAWTTPATWTNGAVTAGTMNTEVRDHFVWLKNALDLVTAATTADSGTATYLNIVRASSGQPVLRGRITGDTQARIEAFSEGQLLLAGSGTEQTTAFRFERHSDNVSAVRLRLSRNSGADASRLWIAGPSGGSPNASGLVISAYANAGQAIPAPALRAYLDAASNPSINFERASGSVTLQSDSDDRLIATGLATRFGVVTSETGEANALFWQRAGDSYPRATVGQASDGLARVMLSGGSASTADVELYRLSARIMAVRDAQLRIHRDTATNPALSIRATADGSDKITAYAGGWIDFSEITAPVAPGSDTARLYCRDNGAGKTQLVARMPSGTVITIATDV